MLVLAVLTGRYVVGRHKLWKTITTLEAEIRGLGPVVEESRADVPSPPVDGLFEVGATKVPRNEFVQIKFQGSACLLKTEDWGAITVDRTPAEIPQGVTIAVRVDAIRRSSLGWWDALRESRANLAMRLAIAIIENNVSRITRVVRTPTRVIALATPVRDQKKRDIIVEIDGGQRMLLWNFYPVRGELDEEFLIDWALKVQY